MPLVMLCRPAGLHCTSTANLQRRRQQQDLRGPVGAELPGVEQPLVTPQVTPLVTPRTAADASAFSQVLPREEPQETLK